MGLEPGQADPGWRVLVLLLRLGLVTRLGLPRAAQRCDDLSPAVDGHIGSTKTPA